MTSIVLGVALCSLLAVIVMVVVALPHLREGEDLLTDSGRERLSEQGQRARRLFGSTAERARGLARRDLDDDAWAPDVPVAPQHAAAPPAPTPVPAPAPAPAPAPVAVPVAAAPPVVPVAPVTPMGAVPDASQDAATTRKRVPAAPGMIGARSTTYRGDGAGDVVSSRSQAWRELAASSDPATRAAARVVDLAATGEGAPVVAGRDVDGEGRTLAS